MWRYLLVFVACGPGSTKLAVPLTPDPAERYGSEVGEGGAGAGLGSQPYVRINMIASPQPGGGALVVLFETRDADGVAEITASLLGTEHALDVTETQTTFALPTQDITTHVRLVVRDNVGNISIADSNDFEIDATGAAAPQVTWSSSPTNNPIGTYEVSNCEAEVSLDQITWEPCAGTHAFTFADDGDYTLRVYMRDFVGNVGPASDAYAWTLDRVAPLITLSAAPVYRTSAPATLAYSVMEAHPGAIERGVSVNGGGSYTVIAADAWTTPSAASSNGRLRVRMTDAAGNTGEAIVSTLFDATPPVVTLLQADGNTVYEPPPVSGESTTLLTLQASDDIGGVEAFCIKQTQGPTLPAAPPTSDPCWKSASVSTSFTLTDYSYRYGTFREIPYRILAWVRDRAGRVSVNTATPGTDRVNLVFDPGDPPALTNVFAAISDTPNWPLTPADTSASSATPIYIAWNASFPNGAPTGPIKIEYSTDDRGFLPVADGVNNDTTMCAMSGGPAFTGCYIWTATNKPSGYYTLRVTATDRKGIATARVTVPPINSIGIEFLAGNTDPGVGGNALSTYFSTVDYKNTCARGTLAVSSRGVVYFLDRKLGLIWVDPSTGNSELLMRLNSGATGPLGNSGPVRLAELSSPDRIDIDYQDRVLVSDKDVVRRIEVDADGLPTTIDRLIGGGAVGTVNGSGLDPLSIRIGCRGCPVTAAPNGDIYLFHNFGSNNTAFRILKYDAATKTVTGIVPTGTGWLADGTASGHSAASAAIDDCRFAPQAVSVDPNTSQMNSALIIVGAYSGDTGPCATQQFGYGWALVGADGQTLPVITPPTAYFNATTSCQTFSGMDGHYYWWQSNSAGSTGNAIVWRQGDTGTWGPVLGTNRYDGSNCEDGTRGDSCFLNVPAYFATRDSELLWTAEGVIRTLDPSGLVKSIMGQSSYYGDQSPALSARIGAMKRFDAYVSGPDLKIMMLDYGNGRFREAVAGGDIETLAGNGTSTLMTQGPTNAFGKPFTFNSETSFAVNPADGRVFLDFDPFAGGPYVGGIATLSRPVARDQAQWTAAVGCRGAGCTPFYGPAAVVPASVGPTNASCPTGSYDPFGPTGPMGVSADGLPGDQIGLSRDPLGPWPGAPSNFYYRDYLYYEILGINAGQLMYAIGRNLSNQLMMCGGNFVGLNIYRDFFLKQYTLTNFTQSHFAGQNGPGSPSGSLAAGQTRSQASLQSMTGWTYGHAGSVHDDFGGRWLVPRNASVYSHEIAALPDVDGPITTWASPVKEFSAFTIRRSGGKEYMYFCKSNFYESTTPQADDGQLYVKNITDGGPETPLPWPIAEMNCRGHKLYWDDRDALNPKLVFIYERNGLYGIAAYRNPPTP